MTNEPRKRLRTLLGLEMLARNLAFRYLPSHTEVAQYA